MEHVSLAKRKLLAGFGLALAAYPRIAAATLEPIEGVPDKPLDEVLEDITTFVLGLGVLLSVLLIVWGGINYIASIGDEERIKSSKKTIHYAVWGVLIMGLSYAVLKVVNDVLTQ